MEALTSYEEPYSLPQEARDGSSRRLAAGHPLNLPKNERPRERLAAFGPTSLSDRELLAVVLTSGIRGKGVSELSAELIERLDAEPTIPSVRDLVLLAGLGEAKACAVAAMLEFGRRRWGPCGSRIANPSDAYPLVRHFADRRQERFVCISLNGAHEVIAVRLVTIGLVNRTVVHPREVFADPLVDRASAIVAAHNHPSGRLTPSAEDEDITTRLKAAGELLGITLLDHLIFTDQGYYSFLQSGKLN
jgi:DNA repair protein RadC